MRKLFAFMLVASFVTLYGTTMASAQEASNPEVVTFTFTTSDHYIPRPAEASDQVDEPRQLIAYDVAGNGYGNVIGQKCLFDVAATNGDSLHLNNYGVLDLGAKEGELSKTEAVANTTVEVLSGTFTVPEVITLYNVMLPGPDGVVGTSVKYVTTVTCVNETPETTTTTTAPETTTTTTAPETTTTTVQITAIIEAGGSCVEAGASGTGPTPSHDELQAQLVRSEPTQVINLGLEMLEAVPGEWLAYATAVPEELLGAEEVATLRWLLDGEVVKEVVIGPCGEPTTSTTEPETTTTTVPPVTGSTLPFTGPEDLVGLGMAGAALLLLGGAIVCATQNPKGVIAA